MKILTAKGVAITSLPTRQLEYIISLPDTDKQWIGCPYSIQEVKENAQFELAARARGTTLHKGN